LHTLIGCVKCDHLTQLRLFGEEADQLLLPGIGVDGFIVLERDLVPQPFSGKEECHEQERRERTGEGSSGAGSRTEAAPRTATAPSSAAHAVGPLTERDILREMRGYGNVRLIPTGSLRFVALRLNIGLFAALPYRAQLFLEVPIMSRRELRARDGWLLPRHALSGAAAHAVVPDVRAWSAWVGGDGDGALVRSHHGFPDESMCVCLPTEWRIDRDPLIEYVDFCVMWIAKALHERELGYYPGGQHYPARRRVQRDRVDEYCGCGGERRYKFCCRSRDLELTVEQRLNEEMQGRAAYLGQLDMQERSRGIPEWVTRELRGRSSRPAKTAVLRAFASESRVKS
jgi:hypothetical protein